MGKTPVNGEINRPSPIFYPYSAAIITGPCVHLNHLQNIKTLSHE
jgi:hypothetical protein